MTWLSFIIKFNLKHSSLSEPNFRDTIAEGAKPETGTGLRTGALNGFYFKEHLATKYYQILQTGYRPIG
jgi:hypothetical protein